MESQAKLYNECNPRDDSYCIFEKQYKELKEKYDLEFTNGKGVELGLLQLENKEVKELVEWKIGQLNYLEKNENYEILDNETNLKVFYHRKGFIEGLEWYLKTLQNTVKEDKGKA